MDANMLYYGDNLDVLRRHIEDETIDLVYLDPPFNSNATYNVLFAEQNGSQAAAQIRAFEDTWRWDKTAATTYQEVVETGGKVSRTLQAFRMVLGDSNMLAYLAMMAPRLVELRRVMKPTASIYLHCDPVASHYLKMLMDAVFGPDTFQNEVIWQKVRASKGQTRGFGAVHDTIFAYRKSDAAFFQRQYVPLDERRIDQHYSRVESGTGRHYMLDNFTQVGAGKPRRFGDRVVAPPPGKHWVWTQERIDAGMNEGCLVFTSKNMVRVKRYLDESRGNPVEDIWTDIPPITNGLIIKWSH